MRKKKRCIRQAGRGGAAQQLLAPFTKTHAQLVSPDILGLVGDLAGGCHFRRFPILSQKDRIHLVGGARRRCAQRSLFHEDTQPAGATTCWSGFGFALAKPSNGGEKRRAPRRVRERTHARNRVFAATQCVLPFRLPRRVGRWRDLQHNMHRKKSDSDHTTWIRIRNCSGKMRVCVPSRASSRYHPRQPTRSA